MPSSSLVVEQKSSYCFRYINIIEIDPILYDRNQEVSYMGSHHHHHQQLLRPLQVNTSTPASTSLDVGLSVCSSQTGNIACFFSHRSLHVIFSVSTSSHFRYRDNWGLHCSHMQPISRSSCSRCCAALLRGCGLSGKYWFSLTNLWSIVTGLFLEYHACYESFSISLA